MRTALSQANMSAATTTPTNTASARLCSTAVTKVTSTMMKTSDVGMRRNVLREAHSNVPMATMTIKPVRAAMGSCSIKGAPNTMNTSNITAATMPLSRARAPELTLIKLWPIMAQPPMPLKSPLNTLAAPWATHSRFPWPRVPVISSKMFNVSKLSMSPTPAATAA